MNTIVRLLARNQVTLPAKIVRALELAEGDHLEVVVDSLGHIALRPTMLVYAGTPEAEALQAKAAADIKAGRYSSFKDTTALQAFLKRQTGQAKSEALPQRTRRRGARSRRRRS